MGFQRNKLWHSREFIYGIYRVRGKNEEKIKFSKFYVRRFEVKVKSAHWEREMYHLLKEQVRPGAPFSWMNMLFAFAK